MVDAWSQYSFDPHILCNLKSYAIHPMIAWYIMSDSLSSLLQSVVFIILLLLIVSYVYSLVGVIIFKTYTQSPRDDLVFNKCFR